MQRCRGRSTSSCSRCGPNSGSTQQRRRPRSACSSRDRASLRLGASFLERQAQVPSALLESLRTRGRSRAQAPRSRVERLSTPEEGEPDREREPALGADGTTAPAVEEAGSPRLFHESYHNRPHTGSTTRRPAKCIRPGRLCKTSRPELSTPEGSRPVASGSAPTTNGPLYETFAILGGGVRSVSEHLAWIG